MWQASTEWWVVGGRWPVAGDGLSGPRRTLRPVMPIVPLCRCLRSTRSIPKKASRWLTRCSVRDHRSFTPSPAPSYRTSNTSGIIPVSSNSTRQWPRNVPPVASIGVAADPRQRLDRSSVYLLACEDGTVQLSVNATRQKLQNMDDNPMVDLRDMDQPGEHRTVVTVSLTRVRAVDMRVPGAVRSSLNR
jgi:hypothetical protein